MRATAALLSASSLPLTDPAALSTAAAAAGWSRDCRGLRGWVWGRRGGEGIELKLFQIQSISIAGRGLVVGPGREQANLRQRAGAPRRHHRLSAIAIAEFMIW